MGNTQSGDNLTIQYTNADIYLGSLSNGRREGRGTYKHSEQHKYEGGWANNQRHGHGTFTYANVPHNITTYIQYYDDNKKERYPSESTKNIAEKSDNDENDSTESDNDNDPNDIGHNDTDIGNKNHGSSKQPVNIMSKHSNGIKIHKRWRSIPPPYPYPIMSKLVSNSLRIEDSTDSSTIAAMLSNLNDFSNPISSLHSPWNINHNGLYIRQDDIQLNQNEEVSIEYGTYIGAWRWDKRHGPGTFSFSNGDVYVGTWEDNNMHGENGQYTFSNGDVYEGEFYNNTLNGIGVLRFVDGGSYIGRWKMNVIVGNGMLKLANGTCIKEEYDNGERIRSTVLATTNENGEIVPVEQVVWEDVAVPYSEEGDNEDSDIAQLSDSNNNTDVMSQIQDKTTIYDSMSIAVLEIDKMKQEAMQELEKQTVMGINVPAGIVPFKHEQSTVGNVLILSSDCIEN